MQQKKNYFTKSYYIDPISNTIFILAQVVFLGYAILHLLSETSFHKPLLDFVSFTLISTIHLYTVKKETHRYAIIALILVIILNTNLTLYFDGIKDIEFIWLFSVPILSFLISGKKSSILLVSFHLILCTLICYFYSDNWVLNEFSFASWFNLVFFMIVISLFFYVYENLREKSQELILKEHMKIPLIDPITTFPNKLALQKDLKNHKELTLMLLDIDHFNDLNYTYGETITNAVFKAISVNLKFILPKDINIYRYHKQFIITFDTYEKDHALKMVSKIFAFFRTSPIELEELSLFIDFTIGISCGKDSTVISQAETAIKEARLSSLKSLFYTEDSTFVTRQKHNISWRQKLIDALEEEALVPYYQPIIDNKSGKVEKYEVLVRIIDGNEVISPYFFLEAAKQASLLTAITKNVINIAFKDIANSTINLSINITEQDLTENYLSHFLLTKCEKYQISPSQITLEILENITNFDNNNWIEQLETLKNTGFKLAIDDFGSESSNFGRLIDIDAELIKIDGIFIKNLDSDKKSQKIVHSIVTLAHDIGVKVVAEYVHNETIQNLIKEYNIEYTQGFYFSEPKPFKERYRD